MTKKIISLAAALLLAAAMCVPAFAAERNFGFNVELNTNAVLLENLDTGETVFEKNADVQVRPASTTKIMAAALAMEMCADLKNTMVTVADDIWAEFDGLNVSTAGLAAGETLSMYDIICCMMLQSGNEAASALAEYYGYDAFVQMMNDKAAALGCTNTHFTNPHGVFETDHYTSARDMAKITEWAISVPGFYEISQMARYDKGASNKNDPVTLATTVLMQDPTSRYYTSYVKGIKTGTTDAAGRCLVSTAQKDGTTYLLVLLGAPLEGDSRVWEDGQSTFTETRLIYDWCFENLTVENVMDEDSAIAEVPLKAAAKRDTLLLYPKDALYTVINNSVETEREFSYEVSIPESVRAPIEAGQIIGSAKVTLNGHYVGEVQLASRESIEKDRFVAAMETISELLHSKAAKIIYIVLIFVIVLYVWYVFAMISRNKKRRKKKAAQRGSSNGTSGARSSGSSNRSNTSRR